MKRLWCLALGVLFVLALAGCTSSPSRSGPDEVLFKGGGFDEFGYNYNARIFMGKADGVDRNP